MKNKWKNIWRGDGIVNFSSSILAIVCGLLFGFIILLSSNPQQAYYGFMMILQGGFTDGIQGIGQMLYLATPIIMTDFLSDLHLRQDFLTLEHPDSLPQELLQQYLSA